MATNVHLILLTKSTDLVLGSNKVIWSFLVAAGLQRKALIPDIYRKGDDRNPHHSGFLIRHDYSTQMTPHVEDIEDLNILSSAQRGCQEAAQVQLDQMDATTKVGENVG